LITASERKEIQIIHLPGRRNALEKRNNNLKEGKEDFYVYRYLSQVGFLPNYAFPSKVTSVRMLHKGEEEEISRDHAIAIREFAPLNTLYYGGLEICSQTVSKEVDPTNKFMAVVCEDCEHVEKLSAGKTSTFKLSKLRLLFGNLKHQ
jgi:hypothetical protein